MTIKKRPYYSPYLQTYSRRLRTTMTRPERKLWYEFLRYQKPQRYRQKPLANYIVDFYCPTLKLIIEIDGSSHYEEGAQAYDTKRSAILVQLGMKVIRYTNYEMGIKFSEVCDSIIWHITNSESNSG